MNRLLSLLALAAAFSLPAPSFAADASAPPALRNSGFSAYLWYPSRHWEEGYGIIGGRCNAAQVGVLARGIFDGANMSRPALNPWGDRPVAVVVGPVLGLALDNRLGRDADAADRGCLGQALELSPDNHLVGWSNHGLNFSIRFMHGVVRDGRLCRPYAGTVLGRDLRLPLNGMACRSGRGLWSTV